ncbi:MAG: hypothetical protein FWE06_02440 [Oscillospiraceae bacterium]|nr:hypothetical protein [Oscillospiraceae bacterium]
MLFVHTFMSNLLLGIIILLFYQKIIHAHSNKTTPILMASFLFAVIMFLSLGYVGEPFRTVAGVASLGLFFRITQHSINWAALILAFLFGHCAWMASAFVSAALGSIFQFYDTDAFFVLVICVETLIYSAIYKIIKLRNGIPAIHDKEFKGIVFAFAGIIVTFWGGYLIAGPYAHEADHLLFYTSAIALGLVILALTILIIYLIKKHRERISFDAQFKDLERQAQNLNGQLGDLTSEQHKYRGIISAVGISHQALLEELDDLKASTSNDRSSDKVFRLGVIEKRLDAIRQFADETSQELAIDDTKDAISLPDEWYPLQALLEEMIRDCAKRNILFAVQNRASWHSLAASKMKFTALVDNLVSNAIKELDQTKATSKQIVATFSEKGGIFRFEIIDNAHEFPIHILAKLGQHGNSTNGTGNGYAEIFAFLAESNASFCIEEWQYGHSGAGKMISIAFDGAARSEIISKYRQEVLLTALAGMDLIVL